jgi:hypothetical protein
MFYQYMCSIAKSRIFRLQLKTAKLPEGRMAFKFSLLRVSNCRAQAVLMFHAFAHTSSVCIHQSA